MDGSGADSCNDLICLWAWRWKDRTPPERIAPSFSVNRVNYLYNEICKVVNFSSSLFLSSLLFLALFGSSAYFPLIHPRKTNLPFPHVLHQLTSLVQIYHHFFSLKPSFMSINASVFVPQPSVCVADSLIERRLLIFPHTEPPLPPTPHRGLGI